MPEAFSLTPAPSPRRGERRRKVGSTKVVILAAQIRCACTFAFAQICQPYTSPDKDSPPERWSLRGGLIQVVIVAGFHLFPFRTEKLSPPAPMVLHTRGRVGSRRFLAKPSREISEAFSLPQVREGTRRRTAGHGGFLLEWSFCVERCVSFICI